MANKCIKNYRSNIAFIDNKSIQINEFIIINNENLKHKLKCKNGHELIFANGIKNKPHFRHKNNEDMHSFPMSEWHYEWQENFSLTEVEFKIKDKNQIKDRRADVVLNNCDYNIEFQHSYIERGEIINRKNDYELHNRKILWVIDGGKSINIKYLNYSKRYFLEFISDKWKFESFIDYDYIFIDINEQIYKIYPGNVKNNMIDVEQPFEKKQFIIYLNENNPIIHNIDIPLQSNLYIKQQGAGNGKTFGLIQNLENKEFEHYKCFIIVTKQHSAKTVIYNEFIEQIDKNYLKKIKNLKYEDNNKKYQISYTNENTGIECNILIATIDSLMWSLGNIKNNDLNKFEGILNSIIDGYLEEQNIDSIKCNNKNYKLNKEMCLFVDETQDLSNDYGRAIFEIMRNRYIDSYIVGDKLQSLKNINNAFNYFQENDFSNINKNLYSSSNICRRFYHNDLVNFVNSVIPFSKYSLPEIIPYKDDDENNINHIVIFEGNDIYADENNENKIKKEIEIIMQHYEDEVNKNNYKPNDFLIITPFTNKNPLVNALEIAIQMFWTGKKNKDIYERYSFFHKSEEGNSINLMDSEDSTRIVSIHTSKGDGRNIVFIIGLDEKSLLKYSNEKNNLIYDSLIHVSITRMKKKLFIRMINNGDDISKKILKFANIYNINTNILPILDIKKKNKYSEIVDFLKSNEDFEKLQNTIIIKTNYNILSNDKDDKNIIDMCHHNIRYASMLISFYIKIINNEQNIYNNKIKKQFQAIFNKINLCIFYKLDTWQEYYDKLKKKELCVLKISKNGKEYETYFNIICSFVDNIKIKILNILKGEIIEFCPLESIILCYIIDILQNGILTFITINEVYNIIDLYSKSFNNNCNGHDKCLCKNYFGNKLNIENNLNIKKMSNYLLNHYESIINIGKIYDKFLLEYPTVNWLINHSINYCGSNNDFEMYKKIKLIGYNDEKVFIIYLKPQFNELNFNDTLIESIYDTFLLKNLKEDENNKKNSKDYERFGKKNIYTIVFSFDNKIYNLFEWKNLSNKEDLIESNKNIIIEQIKNKLINKYNIQSKYLINYYKYWKEIYKNLETDKIIKSIIKKYKENKLYDKMPPFILKFFEKIEFELLYNKNKKNEIFIMYDNNDYFSEKLEEVIKDSIEDYLFINDI